MRSHSSSLKHSHLEFVRSLANFLYYIVQFSIISSLGPFHYDYLLLNCIPITDIIKASMRKLY